MQPHNKVLVSSLPRVCVGIVQLRGYPQPVAHLLINYQHSVTATHHCGPSVPTLSGAPVSRHPKPHQRTRPLSSPVGTIDSCRLWVCRPHRPLKVRRRELVRFCLRLSWAASLWRRISPPGRKSSWSRQCPAKSVDLHICSRKDLP